MDQTRGTKEGVQDLADQIMNAYDAYRQDMVEQINTADELRVRELDLEATQDAIILDQERLDGKNAEVRAAQMRALTEPQYLAHRAAEGRYQGARLRTTLTYELLRTLRALSSLISGTSHA